MVRPSAFWSGLARRSSDGVGGEHDRLEQLVEAGAGLGRDVDEHRVAAVLLGHESVLGELAAGLARVGVGLVDLVHRDHDRHAGGLGVVERLDRLRHDAVVGRDHEHRDVGGLGTTGTHGGERLVTGGVDEGDATLGAVDLGGDLVGTDGLRDATGLLVDDVAVAQRVEQLGLAVVDVTHDGDDRRTRGEILLDALVLAELEAERLQQLAVLFLRRDDLDVVVELLTEDLQDVVVDRLRGGDHLTEVEQHLHQRCRVGTDLVGEVAQRGAAGEPDGLALALADAHAADGGRLHLVEFLTLRALALASTPGRAAGATERALRAAAAATTGTAGTTTGAAEAATGASAAGAAEAATAAAATGTACAGRCTAAAAGAAGAIVGASTGATTGSTRATLAGGGSTGEAGLPGHHRRVGARHAGTSGRAALTGRRRDAARAPAACPDATRTGCCRAGRHRGAGQVAGRPASRPGLVGRRLVSSGRFGRFCGLVDGDLGFRLDDGGLLGHLGNLGDLGWRLDDLRRSFFRRGGLGRLGLGRSLLGRRLLGSLLLALLAQGFAVLLVEAAHDGRLDGGRRGLHVFTHVLQGGQDDLAGDSELLGKLVDSDSHSSPSGVRPEGGSDH